MATAVLNPPVPQPVHADATSLMSVNRLAPLSQPTALTEIPSASDTFEVGQGHTVLILGRMFRTGDVLPGWFCDHDKGLIGRVKAGALVKTVKPRNVEVSLPQPKTDADPVPALATENVRLTNEVEQLTSGNKMLIAQLTEVKEMADGRVAALTRLTDEVSHYRAQLSGREGELLATQRDLEESKAEAARLAAENRELLAELEAARAAPQEKKTNKRA